MVLVDTDEICAAIKDVFEDTRSILEPAGALATITCNHLWYHSETNAVGAIMPNLTIKDLPERIHKELKNAARSQDRRGT